MDKLRRQAQARYAFDAFLEDSGKRRTPVRFHVLDVALTIEGRFSAPQLLEACNADRRMLVSRASVFNTLPLLVDAGVLRRVEFCGQTVYESAAAKPRALQVLVCNECGRVKHLQAPALQKWIEAQSFRDFTPQSAGAQLTLYGICSRCRRQRHSKTKE